VPSFLKKCFLYFLSIVFLKIFTPTICFSQWPVAHISPISLTIKGMGVTTVAPLFPENDRPGVVFSGHI